MKKILTLILCLAFTAMQLNAAEYQVDGSKKNNVKFISDAPIEDFEGNTNKIDGYIVLENDNALYNSEVYFEVDLNSVDTGIGLRNRHMREEYLHTDKYPMTTFKGRMNEVNKVNDSEYNVKVTGDMYIHGITKKIMVTGKIYLNQGGMRVKTEFIVKLGDYKIEVPKMMFMKISEDIKLVLDFNLKKVS